MLIYNLCSSQTDIDFSKLSITESRVDSINLYFNKLLKSEGEKKERIRETVF